MAPIMYVEVQNVTASTLYGALFKDGEPLDAGMLQSESQFLIDHVSAHQMLPTVDSGLIGQLDDQGKWKPISLTRNGSKLTLPFGTVFRLSNGFVGKLAKDLLFERLTPDFTEVFLIVRQINVRERTSSNQSRFVASIENIQPNGTAHCRIKLNDSDFGSVYLESTSGGAEIKKWLADQIDQLKADIIQAMQTYISEKPLASAFLVSELTSLSRLHQVLQREWILVSEFRDLLQPLAAASSLLWNNVLNEALPVTPNVRPMVLDQFSRAHIEHWLESYKTFISEAFFDKSWQGSPLLIDGAYTIASKPTSLKDYEESADVGTERGRGVKDYGAGESKIFSPSESATRLYLKLEIPKEHTEPAVLLYRTDEDKEFEGPGLFKLNHRKNDWYWVDLPAKAKGIETAILSHWTIIAMHEANLGSN